MGIRPCDKSISFRGYETLLPPKKKNVFEANYSSDHPGSSGGNPRGTNVAFGSAPVGPDSITRRATFGQGLTSPNSVQE
jgi:hypothetical protein